MMLAARMQAMFYKLIAFGLGMEYGLQVLLTAGGAAKFIPSTGVTLPFVSYGGSSILSTCILFAVIQQIEGNLIYPRVVGTSIGLPGLWVLAAVTVGGGILGIGGMLLGVPVAAAVYRLIRADLKKREVPQMESPSQADAETESVPQQAVE